MQIEFRWLGIIGSAVLLLVYLIYVGIGIQTLLFGKGMAWSGLAIILFSIPFLMAGVVGIVGGFIAKDSALGGGLLQLGVGIGGLVITWDSTDTMSPLLRIGFIVLIIGGIITVFSPRTTYLEVA